MSNKLNFIFYLKLFLLFFITFFVLTNKSEATFKYKLDQKISGEFKVNSRTSISLPEGEWKVIYRYGEHIFRGVYAYQITLAQVSNKNVVKLFEIEKIEGLSAILGYITPIIVDAVFKPKRHGCVERNYYTLLKYYRSSGVSHNCVSIKHIDTNYELFENDDPNTNLGYLINWAKKNNLNYSDVYLAYDVSIYIPRISDRYLSFSYYESPQYFADFIPQFSSEQQSEFHPQNINQNKEAKIVMNKWINYIAHYHGVIEKSLKIKGKYKINFDRKVINQSSSGKNNELVEMLEKLNELYRLNVLTKDEFTKAKEKLLNQYN